MKKRCRCSANLLFLLLALCVQAQTVRHVWTNSPAPAAPYNAWTNAARVIQDAVNAADPYDIILVTNGVYNAGGQRSGGATTLTNRVYAYKPLSFTSVNGPSKAFIVGQTDPVTLSNGPAAIRGLYLVEGCSLSGFTVMGGYTRTDTGNSNGWGGGVYCAGTNVVITNCVIIGNMAHERGGGVYQGTLYDCGIFSNSLTYGDNSYGCGAYSSVAHRCWFEGNYALGYGRGAGASHSKLYDCDFTRNRGSFGPATISSTLYGCRVFGHTANRILYSSTVYNSSIYSNTATYAAAAESSTLYDCDIFGNHCGQGTLTYCTAWRCNIVSNIGDYSSLQRMGTGALLSTLYNCTISYNTSIDLGYAGEAAGAGAHQSHLYNCLVSHNTALGGNGAGVVTGNLYNCTIVSNVAVRAGSRGGTGGGVVNTTNYNCVIYFNTAYSASNWFGAASLFFNTCTAPAQAGWAEGNITADPLFAAPGLNNWRLTKSSPCLNKGLYFPWMTDPADGRSSDLDGGPRLRHNAVDMGAYELRLPRGSMFSAE